MPGFWAGLGRSRPISTAVRNYQESLDRQLRRQIEEQNLKNKMLDVEGRRQGLDHASNMNPLLLEAARLANEATKQDIQFGTEINPLKIRQAETGIEQSVFDLLKDRQTFPHQLNIIKEEADQAGIQTDLLGFEKAFQEGTLDERIRQSGLNVDLLDLEKTFREGTLPDRIRQAGLTTEGMALGNQGRRLQNERQEWENRYFQDTFEDKKRIEELKVLSGEISLEQANQEIELSALKIQQQQEFLSRYGQILDNQVREGKITNAEKEFALAKTMQDLEKSQQQEIIEYYATNPDALALAIHRGVVTPEFVQRVEEHLGINIFQFDDTGEKPPITSTVLNLMEKEYNRTFYDQNQFSGVLTPKEGMEIPNFRDYIISTYGIDPFGIGIEQEKIDIVKPEAKPEESIPEDISSIVKEAGELIPAEALQNKNEVISYLMDAESFNLSKEEAEQVYNLLTGNTPPVNILNTDIGMPDLINLLGPPDTTWNEQGERLFSDKRGTVNIPFLPDNFKINLF